MLVTFKSKVYGEFTMFGDIAERLLKMMGHSGTIPSAISAVDVPAALKRLKSAIDAEKNAAAEETGDTEDEENEEPVVSLEIRAYPLIEMLTAAANSHSNVMWYKH